MGGNLQRDTYRTPGAVQGRRVTGVPVAAISIGK